MPNASSTPWNCSRATGHGDVKALKGALKGRYRLRVGKSRAFFSLDQPGTVALSDIDNRGQAY
jgi:mRNA-degrading endonuclease RelE of RelBE toxin-antitoxin system